MGIGMGKKVPYVLGDDLLGDAAEVEIDEIGYERHD